MRVLHVLRLDIVAGTELMVADLVLRHDPEAVCHEVATLGQAGPIAERLREANRTGISLGGGGGFVAACWRLGRLLRSARYDVVNAYGLKASVPSRILVRLLQPGAAFVCGVRALHVVEVERVDSLKGRIAWLLERLLQRLVEVYDSNSRAALDLLAEHGVDPSRFVHIPSGLDLSQWKPPKPDRAEDGSPLILCAARFVDRKRHQDMLHALAALKRDGHHFRAVLAGAGPRLTEMRALSCALNLDDRVELPGEVSTADIRALLEEAAAVCLPSAYEGMPAILMEAMAAGVAVIGTDVPGTDELVVNGESGLLVPAYDPPALAKALAALLDDPELRARLARGGRRRIEERFSLERMLEAKESLYRRLAPTL